MIEYDGIRSNEKGSFVRAKINGMFSAIINGAEGINKIWENLKNVIGRFGDLSRDTNSKLEIMQTQILNEHRYIDSVAEDLRMYINGMNGGISGFAVDTEFMPKFPIERAATVLAAGAGTYKNMLDVNGKPITISDPDALTIFYKGAMSNYWQYKSIFVTVNIDHIDGGNAKTKYVIKNRT